MTIKAAIGSGLLLLFAVHYGCTPFSPKPKSNNLIVGVWETTFSQEIADEVIIPERPNSSTLVSFVSQVQFAADSFHVEVKGTTLPRRESLVLSGRYEVTSDTLWIMTGASTHEDSRGLPYKFIVSTDSLYLQSLPIEVFGAAPGEKAVPVPGIFWEVGPAYRTAIGGPDAGTFYRLK